MSQSQWKRRGGGGGGGVPYSRKPCPNPLFEQWLNEWKEDAAQKNSKMQYVYAKALTSLRKYPLSLANGRECAMLEFFGPSICKLIDNRMVLENISQGDSEGLSQVFDPDSQDNPYKKPPKKRAKKAKDGNVSQDGDSSAGQPPKKAPKRGTKAYIPGFRSGAYALLVSLGLRESKPGYRGYMTKSELAQEAQSHCDASMTRSDNPGGNYTAWNAMSGLITKGYIIKQGNPPQLAIRNVVEIVVLRFMLSPDGRELAGKLLQAENGGNPNIPKNSNSNSEDVDTDSQAESGPADAATHYRTHLEPGKFEVVLYVDTSETTAKCKKEEVLGELRKNGVNLEVMKLSVGDFVWVCREVVQSTGNRNRLTISRTAEVVIPFIVERKRSDDLAHSIKDGRFHEQKYRLQQTGLQPIYLIESYGKGDWGLADGALNQAVANTQMTNDFLIQHTDSIKDTCGYLTHMTRHLTRMYESKRISSCTKQEWPVLKQHSSKPEIYLMTFSDLNDFGIKAKNWTVTEMFARHLMRLRGLSVERATAIIERYPTLQSLLRAYRDCSTDKEREMLLSSIYFGTGGRTVGPAISRSIFKLYNLTRLG